MNTNIEETINETLGRKSKKNNLPVFIEHNNTTITDQNEIVNTFNDIGTSLASSINVDGNN